MTTLPTTTPMRLPRPVGAGALAVPAPLASAAQSSTQLTGADVWRVIRSNILLILLSMIVCGGLGYGLFWYLQKYHSSYTATGYVQINPPVSFTLLDKQPVTTDVSSINLDQRTQAALLKQDALFV